MPLIPDNKVARERYHVCLKTLKRWDEKPELGFPAAEWINGRKYRDTDKLDAWDTGRAVTKPLKPIARGVAAKPDRKFPDKDAEGNGVAPVGGEHRSTQSA
jgi:hypothetical protein